MNLDRIWSIAFLKGISAQPGISQGQLAVLWRRTWHSGGSYRWRQEKGTDADGVLRSVPCRAHCRHFSKPSVSWKVARGNNWLPRNPNGDKRRDSGDHSPVRWLAANLHAVLVYRWSSSLPLEMNIFLTFDKRPICDNFCYESHAGFIFALTLLCM